MDRLKNSEDLGEGIHIPPVTYKERALFQAVEEILGTSHFGITDDLFELGMTNEQADALVSKAAENGLALTNAEIKKYRTIEKIVKGTDKTCRWLNDNNSGKPVLVLVHGVTPESYYMPIMDSLKERFSVLDIEPIVEHWQYAFKGELIGDVINFYSDMIRYYLPEGTTVYAFLGHSFGGDIAYRLAERWEKDLGEHPYVYMVDTYLRVYDATHFEEYKHDLLNRFDFQTRVKVEAFWMVSAYCLDVAKKLGDGKAMPSYPGPVRLFSATQVKEDPTLAQVLPVKAVMRDDNPNVQAWKALAPDLIVDYVDSDHITILTVPEFRDILFHRIDTDMRRGVH